jgi:response regulator NasT
MEPKNVNKLILVIDADNTIQDRLTPRLRAQGHAVMGINSGERALPLVKAVLPDLIIADLQDADLTGIELVNGIRAISQTETTPIIIYTKSRDESLLKQIRRHSGTFVVAKSAPMEQLLSKVNAALGSVRVEASQT